MKELRDYYTEMHAKWGSSLCSLILLTSIVSSGTWYCVSVELACCIAGGTFCLGDCLPCSVALRGLSIYYLRVKEV